MILLECSIWLFLCAKNVKINLRHSKKCTTYGMFTVTKICFPCSFKKSQTIAADATCRNDFNIRIYRQERMKINALINLCCG